MPQNKLFAGGALRRLRRIEGLTQAAMADTLDISPSYLNLLERNQRPLSARLMLAFAEKFDVDPRALTAEEPGGGIEAVRKRLGDPIFDDLEVDRSEIEEWLSVAPNAVEAFARLFDRGHAEGAALWAGSKADPLALVRQEIERWRNHFADLDVSAEELADEMRIQSGDLYAAIAERLRTRHQLMIRILPGNVMPDRLRRFDLHARQLQLSEMLDPASRTFHAAYLLGQLEQREAVQALVGGAGLDNRPAERLLQRHIYGYFAAALLMPYSRFLRACEQTGYDILVLQRRFGVGFEQVAHRLTTLGRVGARGLPFFMVRVDRAGQFSKAYAGASNTDLAHRGGHCPLWHLYHAFDTPGTIRTQLVETEDSSRWLTLSRTVQGPGYGASDTVPEFAIGLGVPAAMADQLCYSRGMDLGDGGATKLGLGCTVCTRAGCTQRASPPASRALRFDERERGLSAFEFAED